MYAKFKSLFIETCQECHGQGKVSVICPTCQSTGQCSKCANATEFNCSRCNGSGLCHNCHGKPVCSLCQGNGQCPHHHQIGLFSLCQINGRCPLCQGEAKEYCFSCGHTHRCPAIKQPQNQVIIHDTIVVCEGQCIVCKGNGSKCTYCNLTGKCLVCHGTGKVNTCPKCLGKKVCSSCYGYKEIRQCSACDGKKRSVTNLARFSIGILVFVFLYLALTWLQPLVRNLRSDQESSAPNYQVTEFDYASAIQACPYSNSWAATSQPTLSDLSPILTNLCDYFRLTSDIEKWGRQDENFQHSRLLSLIGEIVQPKDFDYDYYLVDKQIIIKIPKDAFQNLREVIFKIVSSELLNIKVFMGQNSVLTKSNLYIIKFYKNPNQLSSYFGLEEGVQAITIPCNYLALPLTTSRSKSQSKESVLRQIFKHEIAHAVMCSSYGIDFWTKLPEWIQEGSAAFYADDQEEPEFISSDKDKAVFSRMPYVRVCYKRAFASASTPIMKALFAKDSSSIHELESNMSCKTERQDCKSECLEKQRKIFNQPDLVDISIVTQTMQEAEECAKKCSFTLSD